MPSNVRIQPDSYAKLRDLARQAGRTMPEILADAIEQLYRQRFFDQCDEDYARLKRDPKAWKEELEERRAWEATLNDGLEEA